MARLDESQRAEIRKMAREEVRRAFPTLKRDLMALKRFITLYTKKFKRIEDVLADHEELLKLQRLEQDVDTIVKARTSRWSIGLIAGLRSRLELTQEEFAALAGVSARSVSQWELGNSAPSLESKTRLVELRKLTPAQARKMLDD